ncbi:MAG: 2-dehydropantoate 2-reductase [Clostridiales bacterium]|nr:2-dehydropantoate 2-reductase [Clostridiales bacterium]
MEILIVGAGAIGVALGAGLADAGQQVSFFARGATLEAIRSGGVHRTGLFGEVHIPPSQVRAESDYAVFAPGQFDYILICAKTLANDDISRKLDAHRDILKPQGRLVILQNGWGNDRPYRRFFSPEQVWNARVITGFERTAPNVSNITVHTAPVLLGSLYGLDCAPMEPLADAIRESGLPAQASNEVDKALWAKMLYNCALNPLGAVLGVHYGALGECPETRAIMDDVVDEIFAVMDAAGYATFWPDSDSYRQEFYGKLLPDTYHHHASTLQDIQAKRPTEIATLTGVILELGREHNVPTPVNTMLYRLIRGMEANY